MTYYTVHTHTHIYYIQCMQACRHHTLYYYGIWFKSSQRGQEFLHKSIKCDTLQLTICTHFINSFSFYYKKKRINKILQWIRAPQWINKRMNEILELIINGKYMYCTHRDEYYRMHQTSVNLLKWHKVQCGIPRMQFLDHIN